MICVNSVTVYPKSITIRKGNWYYDAWADISSNCPECAGVRWYSSDISIAGVNATAGYIYGNRTGTTRVYAEATDGSGKRDYITVTVTSAPIYVSSVELNRSYVYLEEGETFDLCAEVCPTYATNRGVTWRSSNTSIATVSSSGEVTARSRGYVTITATANDGSGKAGCCDFYITGDVLVTSVSVSPSSKTVSVGNSFGVYESVCPTTATNKGVRWKSDNNNVATVTQSGLVMAQGVGSTTITATACDGSGKVGTCRVTVNARIPVTGVDVSPAAKSMNVGDTDYVCANVCPNNATNQSVMWCSSDESVATVGRYTGYVTAKKAGSVTITATTVDGEFCDCITIYVRKNKIYQTENTYIYDGNGCIPEDLKYDDISENDLKAMDWINWSDFVLTTPAEFRASWEYMVTTLFSTEPLQTVVLDMIEHFMSGDGSNYSNSILTEKVLEHTSTQNYITTVKNCVVQLLSQYNGDISALTYVAGSRDNNPLVELMKTSRVLEPVYNTTSDKINGLTICIDSLWGNQIEVKEYNKTGNSYSGTLSFTLYDHFGLDVFDVEKYGYLVGFRAWYILQHNEKYNGEYKPFVTTINFEVPFSGSF